MRTLLDIAGNVIAWVDDSGNCENKHCRKDIREGRPVHIIPAPSDPRAEWFSLALREYHYASEDEALLALEAGWLTDLIANTAEERDLLYALNRPVKIAKGVR